MIDTSGISTIQPVYLPQPMNPSHPLNQGRVAWYLALPGLDGGRFFYDIASGLYPCTLANMDSASGWRGTTRPGGYVDLLFDGVDDYAGIDRQMIPSSLAAFSFGCSFNLAAIPGQLKLLCGQGTTAGGGFMYLSVNSSGKIDFTVDGNTDILSTATLSAGVWYRALLTYSAANSPKTTLYLNGVADNTQNTAADYTGDKWRIGISPSGNTARCFAGLMDDLPIWSRDLSPAEAKAEYDLSLLRYQGVLNRLSRVFYSVPVSVLSGLLLARRRRLVA